VTRKKRRCPDENELLRLLDPRHPRALDEHVRLCPLCRKLAVVLATLGPW